MKYYLIIPFLILLVGCLQPEKTMFVYKTTNRLLTINLPNYESATHC